MLDWLTGIGRQVLRAFGLGPKALPFEWGKTVFPVADRAPIDALWWTQHAIVTSRGTAAAVVVADMVMPIAVQVGQGWC